MANHNTKPDVEAIVQELRGGMQDNAMSHPEDSDEANRCGLRASLRQAANTANVLGRCGGSLRGKFCKCLAPLVLPVVEQLNLHHGAVVTTLQHIHDPKEHADKTEARISKLEAEIEALKQEIQS